MILCHWFYTYFHYCIEFELMCSDIAPRNSFNFHVDSAKLQVCEQCSLLRLCGIPWSQL